MGWGALVGAAISAYGANRAASSARRGSAGAGEVNISRDAQPWDQSRGYREAGMAQAARLLSRPNFWEQQPQPGRRGARGRGGGGGAPQGGNPGLSDQLIRGMADRAQAGHPLYDPANRFAAGTLGGEDQNPYRQDVYGALEGYSPDRLYDFQDRLMSGGLDGLFGPSSSSGRGGGYGGGVANQQINFETTSPVDAASYTKRILDGQFLNEGNPYQDRMIDAMTDRIRREYGETVIPGVTSEAIGAGMMGSGVFSNALAMSGREMGREMSDAITGVQFQDYNAERDRMMQALGVGAGLDTAAWNNQTQLAMENMAGNRAAQGASAAYASAGQDRESRERMAMLDALLQSQGMGLQADQFGLMGRMNMAQGFSDDQMGVLGSVGELSGLGLRDYGIATDFSLRQDAANDQRRAAAAAAGRYRDERDYRRRMEQQALPWQQLGNFSDVINALSGGFGTTTESGYDRRSQSPSNVSVPGQTISGAIGGAYMGNQLADLFRQYQAGRGGGAPAGGGYAPPYNTYTGGNYVPPQWVGTY
jgi:hypothetical protein